MKIWDTTCVVYCLSSFSGKKLSRVANSHVILLGILDGLSQTYPRFRATRTAKATALRNCRKAIKLLISDLTGQSTFPPSHHAKRTALERPVTNQRAAKPVKSRAVLVTC
jgi:hypothetical protein